MSRPLRAPHRGPGIELPNTPEISPDVAGWRRERLPKLPRKGPIRVVPDWVCEILSPTTRRHDMLHKLPYYYAKVGVAAMWLVDLEARVLTAQRLESGRWVTIGAYSDETEVRIEPFEAVTPNVASWWPPAGSVEDDGDDLDRRRGSTAQAGERWSWRRPDDAPDLLLSSSSPPQDRLR